MKAAPLTSPASRRRMAWWTAAGATALAGALFFGVRDPSSEVVELSFERASTGGDADEQTLRSIRKAGDLHLVRYYGDYEARLQWLDEYHRKAADLAAAQSCSLFTAHTKAGRPLLGRNFDRLDKNPVLARFEPPGKFASFAFCPDEAGDHLRNLIAAGASPSDELKNKFLFTLPFYVADGINEEGLAIAIAGAPLRRVKRRENSRPMFVLLFIRRVLDSCRNVEEAARLAGTVSPYDRNLETISHHFLAADAEGNWLVIDYPDGGLRLTRGRGKPQARTNHFLEGGSSSSDTRTSFSRYDRIAEALNSPKPLDSEAEAMELLKRVRGDTVWSVVYDVRGRGGLVAVRENYRRQYRFGF
jgi:hypothetical protein